jgi:hypothetical protein
VPIPQAPVPQSPAPQADPRRAWLSAQLVQVDQQLGQLKLERKSIGGPLVQMILGYSGALVCSAVALGRFGVTQDDAYDEYDHVSHHDQETARITGYAFTGLAVVGLAVGISGTVRLLRNKEANRGVNAARRSLIAQRSVLRQQLSYGASVGPGQLRLGVHGRF